MGAGLNVGVEYISGVASAKPIMVKSPSASGISSSVEMIMNCDDSPGGIASPMQKTLVENLSVF